MKMSSSIMISKVIFFQELRDFNARLQTIKKWSTRKSNFFDMDQKLNLKLTAKCRPPFKKSMGQFRDILHVPKYQKF